MAASPSGANSNAAWVDEAGMPGRDRIDARCNEFASVGRSVPSLGERDGRAANAHLVRLSAGGKPENPFSSAGPGHDKIEAAAVAVTAGLRAGDLSGRQFAGKLAFLHGARTLGGRSRCKHRRPSIHKPTLSHGDDLYWLSKRQLGPWLQTGRPLVLPLWVRPVASG